MDLLEECIDSLGNGIKIIEKKEDKKAIVGNLVKDFPPTSWGRIDWVLVKNKKHIGSKSQLFNLLEQSKKDIAAPIYVIWDEASLPVIESDLNKIFNNLEDVTAVSFDTWLYCPNEGWVLEFHHDGEITIGFIK